MFYNYFFLCKGKAIRVRLLWTKLIQTGLFSRTTKTKNLKIICQPKNFILTIFLFFEIGHYISKVSLILKVFFRCDKKEWGVKFVWSKWAQTYPFFNSAKTKNIKIVFVVNFFRKECRNIFWNLQLLKFPHFKGRFKCEGGEVN